MECHLFGTKLLSEAIMAYFFVETLTTNFTKIRIKIQWLFKDKFKMLFEKKKKKKIGHFVPASMR